MELLEVNGIGEDNNRRGIHD